MTPAEFRAYSAERGLTIDRTAQLCRVTPSAVSKWRSGARRVPAWAVALLELELARQAQASELAT